MHAILIIYKPCGVQFIGIYKVTLYYYSRYQNAMIADFGSMVSLVPNSIV